MKALLKLLIVRITLGEKLFTTKTLTKWLSELSQRFPFLLSYWQPAYSSGQILTPQLQLNSQAMASQQLETLSVSQEHLDTQSAQGRKKKITTSTYINQEEKPGRLSGLTEALKFDGLKLRLFNGLYTFWDNKRLRWGMLLLMLLAPLSKFFYLVLPKNGFGDYLLDVGSIQILNSIEGLENGWYFNTFYMYTWSVGELMAPVVFMFGIFLLFPKKYYPSYLVGVPFGYYLSMLVHRMFFVNDLESFHGGATTTMTMTFLLLGVVFFMVSDKVLFKQNHQKRAAEARIIGLVNMPGMSWSDKEEIIRKEVKEVMKVDNELFIKESA